MVKTTDLLCCLGFCLYHFISQNFRQLKLSEAAVETTNFPAKTKSLEEIVLKKIKKS